MNNEEIKIFLLKLARLGGVYMFQIQLMMITHSLPTIGDDELPFEDDIKSTLEYVLSVRDELLITEKFEDVINIKYLLMERFSLDTIALLEKLYDQVKELSGKLDLTCENLNTLMNVISNRKGEVSQQGVADAYRNIQSIMNLFNGIYHLHHRRDNGLIYAFYPENKMGSEILSTLLKADNIRMRVETTDTFTMHIPPNDKHLLIYSVMDNIPFMVPADALVSSNNAPNDEEVCEFLTEFAYNMDIINRSNDSDNMKLDTSVFVLSEPDADGVIKANIPFLYNEQTSIDRFDKYTFKISC